MESYIVRLYRRDVENPDCLVGLVETVGEKETRSFHTISELVAILSGPSPRNTSVSRPVLRIIEATGKKSPR